MRRGQKFIKTDFENLEFDEYDLTSQSPSKRYVEYQTNKFIKSNNFDMLKSPSFFIQSSFKQQGNFSNMGRSSNRLSFRLSHQIQLKKQPPVSVFNDFDEPLIRSEIRSQKQFYPSSIKVNSDKELQEEIDTQMFLQVKLQELNLLSAEMISLCKEIQLMHEDNAFSVFKEEKTQCYPIQVTWKKKNIDYDNLQLFTSNRKAPLVINMDQAINTEQKNISLISTKMKEIQGFLSDVLRQKDKQSSIRSRIGKINDEDGSLHKFYKCKYCKAKFRKACSLGGHTSRIHKNESKILKIQNRVITKQLLNKRRNRLLESHIEKEVENLINQTKYEDI